jgi:N-methylhydantoinase B
VYAVIWSAAGGFGDPLERDPLKVREDVLDQRSVSLGAARSIYGVVIDRDHLDPVATKKLRDEMRAANRKQGAAKLSGKVVARITDNLELRREGGALRCACARCAADLGPVRENYKNHCVRRESDISAANPNIGDYKRYIDDRPVFRQFYCPGCGALVENEIARADDPVLRDIELEMRELDPR